MTAGRHRLRPQVIKVVIPAVVIAVAIVAVVIAVVVAVVVVVVVVVVGAAELVVDSLLLDIVGFLVSRVKPEQGRLGKSGSPGERQRVRLDRGLMRPETDLILPRPELSRDRVEALASTSGFQSSA